MKRRVAGIYGGDGDRLFIAREETERATVSAAWSSPRRRRIRAPPVATYRRISPGWIERTPSTRARGQRDHERKYQHRKTSSGGAHHIDSSRPSGGVNGAQFFDAARNGDRERRLGEASVRTHTRRRAATRPWQSSRSLTERDHDTCVRGSSSQGTNKSSCRTLLRPPVVGRDTLSDRAFEECARSR